MKETDTTLGRCVNAPSARWVRKVVPSAVLLSNSRLMGPLDALDRGLSKLLGYSDLPPNRFRIRVGSSGRIFANQSQFIEIGYTVWMDLWGAGLVANDSRILDIGCGCGRLARPLTKMHHFTGHYLGVDVDRELIAWNQANITDARTTFVHADVYNGLYNPHGQHEPYRFPCEDEDRDTVMSFSVFTHLLEADVARYLTECRRVLRPGGRIILTVFCLEDLQEAGLLGSRWTLRHRVGEAFVENVRYPEAAVGFTRATLTNMCEASGFHSIAVRRAGWVQSWLTASA